jgi:hypothetical protein
LFCFVFWDRVSLCRSGPGWPWTFDTPAWASSKCWNYRHVSPHRLSVKFYDIIHTVLPILVNLFLLLFFVARINFFFPFLWRQGLTVYSRLDSNPWSFCLSLLSAGVAGMYHHAWPKFSYSNNLYVLYTCIICK